MASRKMYMPDKTISTPLPYREESANGVTSEGASSVDNTDFKDHEFKVPAVPAEKPSLKRSKKRKHFELEEKYSDYVLPEELEINTCIAKEPVQNVSESSKQEQISSCRGLKAKSEQNYKEILSLYCVNTSRKPLTEKEPIGFYRKKARVKRYEDIFYELPPGVGTPPEEVEDIPDELLLWPKFHQRLKANGDFTMEEVGLVIEERIAFLLDYFQRFEEGKLTKEERQNGKKPPENFFGPYLPTPKHIKKLRSLDIEIKWPLSELHELCLRRNTFNVENLNFLRKINKGRGRNDCIDMKIGAISDREAEVLVKNWVKFQKEYKFYDIRPLLDVKCVRLLRKGDKLEPIKYNYITREMRVKFLLYLMQGLPDRGTGRIYSYMKSMCIRIQGSELKAKYSMKPSLFHKYGLEYIFRKFGVHWNLAELLLGNEPSKYWRTFFYVDVAEENIPMRSGPWLPSEMKRLEKGILTLFGIKSLKETISRKFEWPKLIPFVRTRPSREYFQHYKTLLRQQDLMKKTILPFAVEKQMIDSMYESGVEFFQDINWDVISKCIPNYKISDLKKHVRYLTLKVPICCRRNFGDTLEYLYKNIDERYRIRNGLTDRKVSIDTTEDEDFSEDLSIMSDTTYMDDLDSDYGYVNELFD